MLGNLSMNKIWEKYSVGVPSTRKNFTNPDCSPFSTISHGAHINTSLNILRKGYLSAGLVFDKSKLNKKRILVNWLSPNQWTIGFRYGNISFNFPFEEIIKNKKFYWIESIAYGIPACRILITENQYDFLEKYYPQKKNGPWWYDSKNKKHYFNSSYCLEFMYEGELSLSNKIKISFVSHNSKYCSEYRNYPRLCKELGLRASKAGAIFISKIIATSQDINFNHFLENDKPTWNLLNAWTKFGTKCYYLKNKINGELKSNDRKSRSIARALYNAYGNESKDEFEILVSFFKNIDELILTCAKLFADEFRLKNYNILIDELQ
jgi:hypothetical protein